MKKYHNEICVTKFWGMCQSTSVIDWKTDWKLGVGNKEFQGKRC